MCYLCGRPLLKTVCFHTPRHGGMAAKTLNVFRMCPNVPECATNVLPNVPNCCSRLFYPRKMRLGYVSEHQELRTPPPPLPLPFARTRCFGAALAATLFAFGDMAICNRHSRLPDVSCSHTNNKWHQRAQHLHNGVSGGVLGCISGALGHA